MRASKEEATNAAAQYVRLLCWLVQEKQKLSERQIEELSVRVSALELEKQELQRALEKTKYGQQVCALVSLLRSQTKPLTAQLRASRCCYEVCSLIRSPHRLRQTGMPAAMASASKGALLCHERLHAQGASWAAQGSSGSHPGSGEVSSPGDDEVVLELCLGEPEVQMRLTHGEVKALTLKRMAAIWKVLVQKLGVCLPEAGRDPNGHLAKRVGVRPPLLHRLRKRLEKLLTIRPLLACFVAR